MTRSQFSKVANQKVKCMAAAHMLLLQHAHMPNSNQLAGILLQRYYHADVYKALALGPFRCGLQKVKMPKHWHQGGLEVWTTAPPLCSFFVRLIRSSFLSVVLLQIRIPHPLAGTLQASPPEGSKPSSPSKSEPPSMWQFL